MSAVDDLVTWLRAQLDHDEGLARMAFAEHNQALASWHEPWSGTVEIGPGEDDLCCNDSGVSRHIVNWDPARVLAEVEAKRQRIDWLTAREHEMPEGFPTYDSCRLLAQPGDLGDLEVGYCSCGLDAWRSKLLRFDALPYAGRPGWREEWTVSAPS